MVSGCSSNSQTSNNTQKQSLPNNIVGTEGLKLIDSEEKIISIIKDEAMYKDWLKIKQSTDNPGDSRESLLKTLEFLKEMHIKYYASSGSYESDIKVLSDQQWKRLSANEQANNINRMKERTKKRADIFKMKILPKVFFSKYNYETPTLVNIDSIENIARKNGFSHTINRSKDEAGYFEFFETVDFAKSIKTENGHQFPNTPHFSIVYTTNNVVSVIKIPIGKGAKVDFSKGLPTKEVYADALHQGFAVRESWLDTSLTAVLSEEAKANVYVKIQDVSRMSPDELIKINANNNPSDLSIWSYEFTVDNKIVHLYSFMGDCFLTISSAEYQTMESFYNKFFKK